MRTLFNRVLQGTAVIAAVLIAFMALSITAQVILRYFFSVTVFWINDFVEYSLLWSTFLGSAYVLSESKHIEMDFFVAKLNPRKKAAVGTATSILGGVVCGIISVFAFLTVLDNFRRGIPVIKTVTVPKYLVLLPIFLGSALLTVQFIIRAGDKWRSIHRAESDSDQVIYDL